MKSITKSEQSSFILPRQNKKDKVKVYNKSFIGNRQFDSMQTHGSERTIHIDPEIVYQLASFGLDRNMVAGFWGMSRAKWNEAVEDYPFLEEVFLMGATAGLAKTAQKLRDLIDDGQLVPILFRMKIGGCIEAEKLIGKQQDTDSAPRVQVFLPSNGRDDVIESSVE